MTFLESAEISAAARIAPKNYNITGREGRTDAWCGGEKGDERKKACNRSWNAKASAAKAYGPDAIKSSCSSRQASTRLCAKKKDV